MPRSPEAKVRSLWICPSIVRFSSYRKNYFRLMCFFCLTRFRGYAKLTSPLR